MEIRNGLFAMASVTACSIYDSSKAGFLCWQLRKIRNEDTNNAFSNLFFRLPYRYVFSAHPVVSSAASSAVTTATLNSIANLKIKRNNGNAGADLGGGCRGCAPPPPPEMTCGFLIQMIFCKKKKMWFIGVEVEQETSAPPPKKNPGSAPDAGFE